MKSGGRVLSCLVVAGIGVAAAGCGETRVSSVQQMEQYVGIWPLLVAQKSGQPEPDGSGWVNERGNVLLLIGWDHHRRYDGDGAMVEFDDHNYIFPLFDAWRSEHNGRTSAKGSILLLLSYNDDGDSSAAQNAATTTAEAAP